MHTLVTICLDFFLLQLSQIGIFKLSHSNCALTKYNIFCSLHHFILQYNMTIFYKTKLTDKEICKINKSVLLYLSPIIFAKLMQAMPFPREDEWTTEWHKPAKFRVSYSLVQM